MTRRPKSASATAAAQAQLASLSQFYTPGLSIDSFAPGHYARVFEAQDLRENRLVAFKVMRPEHLVDNGQPSWESTAFLNEADLLARLSNVPAVPRLFDCGYVESTDDVPLDGQIASFEGDINGFRQAQGEYTKRRWRPYLTIEALPRGQNLLYVMKPNVPGVRWRLPTEEGLDLSLQFASLLQIAHRQRIVYLDHKLEHVYWDGAMLRLIDWNSSRRITDNNNSTFAAQVQSDLHHLCVGVLYPIFTGLSPQKGSLMPQPGDQGMVDARYADITNLDFGVEPTLSPTLQALVEQGARRQLTSVDQLIAGLGRVASEYGWDSPDGARAQVRAGLRKLRQGQESIREARDLLRDAAVMDDVSDELDGELRRLLSKINEMLNYRALP